MLNPKDYLKSKILMVDDEPSNISLLENMMMQEGYVHLYSTTDPTQVMELFSKIGRASCRERV